VCLVVEISDELQVGAVCLEYDTIAHLSDEYLSGQVDIVGRRGKEEEEEEEGIHRGGRRVCFG
jgi:hypothetical protein